MNKQYPGKGIGWTDYTFNPIKGLCPVGCWFCYARKMYLPGFYSKKPPFNNPKVRFILDDSDYIERFSNKLKLPAGTKVFICSTFEIFHPTVRNEWRDIIFLIIEENPDITFQILTKMPENIDRPIPDNVWLGVSVGDNISATTARMNQFIKHIKKNEGFYFMSLEPLMKDQSEICYASFENIFPYFGWVIVGRLTGHGKGYDPPKERIEWIVDNCQELQIPIYLKNNLKEIWGEKLIQEFPE